MFSGIITECLAPLDCKASSQLIEVNFPRPASYKNLEEGESISVNGVCLTLDKLQKTSMAFKIGPETLKITKWKELSFQKRSFNLERAIFFNQPFGGHFITGHVDGLAHLISLKKKGESKIISLNLPKEFQKFFWKKGYIALNGASLTVNNVEKNRVEVCLIPKTLEKTNLKFLKKGDFINFEVDCQARLFVCGFENVVNKKNRLV